MMKSIKRMCAPLLCLVLAMSCVAMLAVPQITARADDTREVRATLIAPQRGMDGQTDENGLYRTWLADAGEGEIWANCNNPGKVTLTLNTYNVQKVEVMSRANDKQGKINVSVDTDSPTLVDLGTMNPWVDNGAVYTVNINEADSQNKNKTVLITVAIVNSAEDASKEFHFFGFNVYSYVDEDEDDAIVGSTLYTYKDSDAGVGYAGFSPNSDMCYRDCNGDGFVTYTFKTLDIQKVEIMSSKKPDSGVVKITVGDRVDPTGHVVGNTTTESVDLKGTGLVNTSVYTVEISKEDSKNSEKAMAIEFAIDTAAYLTNGRNPGAEYVEFYGFKVWKYLTEDEINNQGVYQLDTTPIDSSLVKEEKGVDAANLVIDTPMTNNGSALVSENKTGKFTYTFKGSAIELRADMRTDGGRMHVQIDGGEKYKVNLYAAEAEENKIVFRMPTLSKYLGNEYVHSLTVTVIEEKHTHSTGNAVYIRGFNVYHEEGSNVEDIDYEQFDLKVDTSWTLGEDEEYVAIASDKIVPSGQYGNDNGNYWGDKVGVTITVTFRGTGIEVYGNRHVDKGKMDVYVDNQLKGRISMYGVNDNGALILRLTDLSKSNHVLKLVNVDDKSPLSQGNGFYIYTDRMKAINKIGDEDKSQKLDVPGDKITQEGFGVTENAAYLGGKAAFSNNMSLEDTYIKIKFVGTNFKLYGDMGSDKGVGSVIVDGETYTFSARGETAISVMLFEISNLDPSVNHEITIWIDPENNPVGSLAYVIIDYLEIEDYAEPMFEGFWEIDDEHRDSGLDPKLPWHEKVDKEFKDDTAPAPTEKTGCGSEVASSSLIFGGIALTLAGALILGKKRRKVSGK